MQNDPFEKRANDLTLKAILICQNHLNILAIDAKLKNNFVFTFFLITLEEILKEIGHFDISKHLKTRMFRPKLSNKIWMYFHLL